MFSGKRHWLNHYMKQRYSAGRLAAFSVLVGAFISILILFVPSYLGVANDGIGNKKMSESGLKYLESDTESFSNDYFDRVYERTTSDREGVSSHLFCIDIAKAMDDFFTKQ